jgi:hypothetical protein
MIRTLLLHRSNFIINYFLRIKRFLHRTSVLNFLVFRIFLSSSLNHQTPVSTLAIPFLSSLQQHSMHSLLAKLKISCLDTMMMKYF